MVKTKQAVTVGEHKDNQSVKLGSEALDAIQKESEHGFSSFNTSKSGANKRNFNENKLSFRFSLLMIRV